GSRPLPAGPVLTAQRVTRRTTPAAQAEGRHPAVGRALPPAVGPQARPGDATTDAGRRARASAVRLAGERARAAARPGTGGHHLDRRPDKPRASIPAQPPPGPAGFNCRRPPPAPPSPNPTP